MNVTLCALCESVARLEDGRPVLFGVFHWFNVHSFPAPLEKAFLALEFEFDPHETGRLFEFLVRMIDEDGAPIVDIEVGHTVAPTQNFLPAFEFIKVPLDQRIVVAKPGLYRFDILVGEDILASARLVAVQVGEMGELEEG